MFPGTKHSWFTEKIGNEFYRTFIRFGTYVKSYMSCTKLSYLFDQGKTECSFYMRTGMCDYGTYCRFDHPDPIFILHFEQESSVVKGESMCNHKEGLELTDAGYVLHYSEATQLNLSVPVITADSFMYMYPNCVLDGYQVCP